MADLTSEAPSARVPGPNELLDGLPISRREADVLAALRERLTNAEIASEAPRSGDSDVAFADLTAAGDGGDVLRVVADAVGVTDEPGRNLADSVLNRLGAAQTLLVLDNCEQVLDEVAERVSWMLAA